MNERKGQEIKVKILTLEACSQMYPLDASAVKNFHIQLVLSAQNLQPVIK